MASNVPGGTFTIRAAQAISSATDAPTSTSNHPMITRAEFLLMEDIVFLVVALGIR
jgi:hypothetical protein